MPTRAQTHIDKALTSLSVAYIQGNSQTFVADKVFPMVPVMKQSDRYFMYKKEDWFSDGAAERAAGTESAGGDYDIDNTPTYFCTKYSYHKDVTEEERTNTDNPLNADQDATDFVTNKLLIRREVSWAAKYFVTGIWGKEYAGQAAADATHVKFWNDPASTPIEDIATAQSDIAELTGFKANKLVLGQRTYDALKNHPDILDRIKYTQKGMVTPDLLAALFEVDEVLIASSVLNNAAKGKDASMSFIFGKHALLCYAAPRPGLKTPSAGYTFAWTGLLGAGAYANRISRIPAPLLGEGTERIEGDMAFDQKLVAADLGCFFKEVVQ